MEPRVRFFKKIQDWLVKSERIRKRIWRFCTKRINPRSLGSWYVKGFFRIKNRTPNIFSLFWFSVPARRQVDALLQPFKTTAFEQYNKNTRSNLQNTHQLNYN